MRTILIFLLLVTLGPTLLRVQKAKTNKPLPRPKIESFEASSKLLMTCGRFNTEVFCSKNRRTTVTLEVKAQDTADEKLTYTYSVSDGEILGEGSRVTWDLQEFAERTIHKATVTVRNSRGGETSASTTVDIVACGECFHPDPPCPTAAVDSYDKDAHRGERVGFEVTVRGEFLERPDYLWTIIGGKILKGQHTPAVQVLVTGDIYSEVTATVEVIGWDASCTGRVASRSLSIQP